MRWSRWRRVGQPSRAPARAAGLGLLAACTLGYAIGPGAAWPTAASAAAPAPSSALRIVSSSPTDNGVDLIVAVPQLLAARTLPTSAFSAAAAERSLQVTASPLGSDDLTVAVLTTGTTGSSAAVRAAAVEMIIALPPNVHVSVVGGNPARVLVAAGQPIAAAVTALRDPAAASSDALTAIDVAAQVVRVTPHGSVIAMGAGLPDAATIASTWPSNVTLYANRRDATGAAAEPEPNRTGGLTTVVASGDEVRAFDQVTADLLGRYRLHVSDVGQASSIHVTVHASDISSSADVALAPVLVPAPPTATTVVLPSPSPSSLPSPPTVSNVPTTNNSHKSRIGGIAVALALIALGAIAVAHRRRRPTDSPAATPAQDLGTPRPQTVAQAPVVVLVSASSPPREKRSSEHVVHSSTEALREVIRLRATTMIVEDGAPDATALTRALANHDQAAGATTRVLTIRRGEVIDLTALEAPPTDQSRDIHEPAPAHELPT